jgi:UDP-2,4-diacetamido-2,4,6-trideoxy-beta-L-altropyranose hydrolase
VTLRVVFRVDASPLIGAGHLSRCLVLADALGEVGAESIFFTRPRGGFPLSDIERRGHKLILLPSCEDDGSFFGLAEDKEVTDVEDALVKLDRRPDWIVIDNYGATEMWFNAMRRNCQRLMAIDDLADRPIDADLVLNQNCYADASDYRHISSRARLLTGSMYALLRREFRLARPEALARRGSPRRRVLVTLGGGDPLGLTVPIVSSLVTEAGVNFDSLCVVLGFAAESRKSAVEKLLEGFPGQHSVLVNSRNMARLMTESDVCIGAAGSSAWERCCLGLPSLVLVLAANQERAARSLSSSGAAVSVGTNLVPAIALKINELLLDPESLRTMADCAARVTDGCGVDRVVQSMLSF